MKKNNKSPSLNKKYNKKNKYYKILKAKCIDFSILIKENLKNNLYIVVFFLIAFIFFNKISFLARISQEKYVFNKVLYAFSNIRYIFKGGLISFNKIDIAISLVILFLIILYFLTRTKRKLKNGVEYGSASWGTSKDIKPYIDPIFEQNILLSQTERITINKPSNIKYARNQNVIVVGGSGSGKTRFFVKPNLMQMHSSYVITDPKGTLLLECGKMLKDNGYKIKVLNTIDFTKSMHYNPFMYIKSEVDILTFVETLISNTQGDAQRDFWVKAEQMLYNALVGYIFYECEEEEKNMESLILLVDNCKIGESDEEKNPVDLLMEDLEKENPNHFAVRQYKKYRNGAKETLQSILVSCGVRLSPFDTEALNKLTSTDDMELDKIGDEKTALFVILSDTNPTFNFIISIMYTQLFNLLCEKADNVYNGKLPVPVRFLLDEFANIGTIPNFDKLIATIRSRGISACPILQTKSQLKSMYKDGKDETIIGNCDTFIFLGGGEKSTLEDVSKTLGKETIDLFTNSDSKGNSCSYSTNYQKTGRELLTEDELAVLDNDKCIVRIRGTRPFLSKKFNIEKHSQYKNLLDYSKKNFFDIKKYLEEINNNQLSLNENDNITFLIDVDDIEDNI